MKSMSTALAAVALSAMLAMSAATAPAEAGPLRDKLKAHAKGAKEIGSIITRCAVSKVFKRVRC
jgi:hypothetical protein